VDYFEFGIGCGWKLIILYFPGKWRHMCDV
jgi:hypothetical protein